MIITALYIRINCPKLLFLVVPSGTPEDNKICCETLKKLTYVYNNKKLRADMRNWYCNGSKPIINSTKIIFYHFYLT